METPKPKAGGRGGSPSPTILPDKCLPGNFRLSILPLGAAGLVSWPPVSHCPGTSSSSLTYGQALNDSSLHQCRRAGSTSSLYDVAPSHSPGTASVGSPAYPRQALPVPPAVLASSQAEGTHDIAGFGLVLFLPTPWRVTPGGYILTAPMLPLPPHPRSRSCTLLWALRLIAHTRGIAADRGDRAAPAPLSFRLGGAFTPPPAGPHFLGRRLQNQLVDTSYKNNRTRTEALLG